MVTFAFLLEGLVLGVLELEAAPCPTVAVCRDAGRLPALVVRWEGAAAFDENAAVPE